MDLFYVLYIFYQLFRASGVLFLSAYLFSQVAVDIFDPFYEDLSVWQDVGLITDAPQLKPYPLQEIKRILEIVIEKGDAGQARIAKEYQNRFF